MATIRKVSQDRLVSLGLTMILYPAAIMRIGLIEMKNFCQEFFNNVKDETFLEESAGVADLITSCESKRAFKAREKPWVPKQIQNVESDRPWGTQSKMCRGVRHSKEGEL